MIFQKGSSRETRHTYVVPASPQSPQHAYISFALHTQIWFIFKANNEPRSGDAAIFIALDAEGGGKALQYCK